jgi:hypothetical protein
VSSTSTAGQEEFDMLADRFTLDFGGASDSLFKSFKSSTAI